MGIYKELELPCKSCLGCQRLENPNFTGDKNCKWQPKIEQIKIGGINERLDRK